MQKDAHPWRELALQRLPRFQDVIREARSHVDLWQEFREILSETSIDESRDDDTKAIYDYAWWCVTASGDPVVALEVETFFYEDLPVYDHFKGQLPRFISPEQFKRLEPCMKYRLTEPEYADLGS